MNRTTATGDRGARIRVIRAPMSGHATLFREILIFATLS